mmetsp:Transcript_28352/g.54016  ORF Transcript_28352/g.54016 Transcript_28352/m.54016 type:complete len:226 (-) Transcript_28352:615-1292(-)
MFETFSVLSLANGFEENVLHSHRDVRAREARRLARQVVKICRREAVRSVPQMHGKHCGSRVLLWEGDVDALIEAPAHSLIEGVGHVGGAQHQHLPSVVVANPLHLNQELCLDSPRCLALAFPARAAQRVQLVNEDDGRRRLPRHLEKLADKLLALAHPLGHQVGGGHRKKRGVRLRGHRLGQVRLAGTGRTVQQQAAPRFTLAGEELRVLDGQDDRLLESLLRAL